MGLLDQLVAEKHRRAVSSMELSEAENVRRDTSNAMGGVADLQDKQSIPSVMKGRFNTGVWQNVVKGSGYGAQALGVKLQNPKRELTVQEYQQRLLPQPFLNESAHTVADSEKSLVPNEMIASHKPTVVSPEAKTLEGPEMRPMHDPTDVDSFYSGPVSTITGKPVSVTRGTREKATVPVDRESLTPMQKFAYDAEQKVGKSMVSAGEGVAEFADKVVKDNPQWQLPSHLQGRGVLETLRADDVSFSDKATMFLGGVAEQTPQVLSTIGLTLAGSAVGGVPGAYGGAALGLGENFMLESGHVYEELKETHPNIAEEELSSIALTHGTVSTALELAPVANLLGKIPGVKKALKDATLREIIRRPSLVKRTTQAMVTQGITEGVTEGLQEVSANAAKGVYQQNPEYFKGIDESIFMGFVMGSLTGGLGSMATHKSAVKQHNDERLHKMSSEQLEELANAPDLMQSEGLSQPEVLEAMEQVRVAEGLMSIQQKLELGDGVPLEELAATESEQAARFLTRARNPERAATLAKIRAQNLSNMDLGVLRKNPEALEKHGLTPETMTALLEERKEEVAEVEFFEEALANAPNDDVRRGIMDTLQGEYYRRMNNIIESRGQATIAEVIAADKPITAKSKREAASEQKPAEKKTKKVETEPTPSTTSTQDNVDDAGDILGTDNTVAEKKTTEETADEVADVIAEESEGNIEDKYEEADKAELSAFQQDNLNTNLKELPTEENDLKEELTKYSSTVTTWEKQIDNATDETGLKTAVIGLKTARVMKKAIEQKLDKLGSKRANMSSKSARIESETEKGTDTLASTEKSVQSDMSSAKVSKKEASAKVKKILGGIPKFVNIDRKIPLVVQEALNQRGVKNRGRRGTVILKSQKPFSAPKWTSRLETDFIDKANHKSSEQWVTAIQQWTKKTTKMKKGKEITIDAKMPRPVQEELEFSGLGEWLADRTGPVSKDEIKEFLKESNRLRLKEKTEGYNHDASAFVEAFKEASVAETQEMTNRQEEVMSVFMEYDPDQASTHQIWADLSDRLIYRMGEFLVDDESIDGAIQQTLEILDEHIERSTDFTGFDHRFKAMSRNRFNKAKIKAYKEARADESLKTSLDRQMSVNAKIGTAKEFWERDKSKFIERLEIPLYIYLEAKAKKDEIGRRVKAEIEESSGPLEEQYAASWDTMVLDGPSDAYRNHLLNLPSKQENWYTIDWKDPKAEERGTEYFRTREDAEAFLEEFPNLAMRDIKKVRRDDEDAAFTGGHFRNMNNVIHVRADVRDLKDDLETLFINEMQSDWHQSGRRFGYGDKTKHNFIEETKVLPQTEKVRDSLAEEAGLIPSEVGLMADDLKSFAVTNAPSKRELPDLIRKLNPVAFKEQLKRNIKRGDMHFWTLTDWEHLSRRSFDAIQELFAVAAEQKYYRSDIPNAPMKNTWETYALKRMVQQAVYEGRNYLTWPGNITQIIEIEHWGDDSVVQLTDGRWVKPFNEFNSIEELSEDIKKADRRYNMKALKGLTVYGTSQRGREYQDFTAIVDRYLVKLGRTANKQFKKYGVKVEEVMLEDGRTVLGFKITPELAEAAKAGLPLASQNEQTQGVYHDGQIYLASDTIESAEEVKGLLVHEGGHYLRRNDEKYQTKYQQLMDRFTSLANSPKDTAESRAIAEAWTLATREKETLDNDLVREEALMYFLQNRANEKLNLWQKFINNIKQWLHRVVGLSPKTLKMSGQEMSEVIISDLRKHVEEVNAVNEEVQQVIQENTLAAKKRGEVKEHKSKPEDERSAADTLLDDIFSTPETVEQAERLEAKDDIDMANTVSKHGTREEHKIAKLQSRILYNDLGTAKAFKREKWEQTSSWLNRVFSSPEYYYTKDTTAKRILDIALEKNDNKFKWKAEVEGDFITVVNEISEKNPRAYNKANKYLLKTDQTGKGFFLREDSNGTWEVHNPEGRVINSSVHEQTAISMMIAAEQKHLKKQRWNKDALRVLEEARLLTNRGFDLTVEDMRRQINTSVENKTPEPTMVFIDDEGVRNDIALSEAITLMGDLRGTYFPRERQNKEFSLQARSKDGSLPNQLHTFDVYMPFNKKDFESQDKLKQLFNANMPVGAKIRELEAQGYTDITLTPVRNPSGMVFDVPGLLMSMDSLLSASDERLSEAEMKEADRAVLTSASEQLSLRIADVYKAKGMFSSRMRRSDILWEGYEEDALKALASYAQRVSTGAAMRETARAMLLTFTGRDVSWKVFQEDNPDAKYIEYRKYVKKKAVNSTTQKQLYEDLRTYMTYVLKPDTRMDRIVGYAKALAVIKFLGLRVSSAGINMTNMAMGVPATMAAHTGLSLAKSWKFIGESAAKYALYRLEQLEQTSDVGKTMVRKTLRMVSDVKVSNADRRIFDEISRRGWDEAQFNHEAARVLQDSSGVIFDKIISTSMYMFGVTEKANRAMTIFAAYKAHEEAQRKKGVTRSEEFYLKLAQQVSNRAHGIYGKAAKPWLVQKARLLDLPYTFQKFQHNYMLNMTEIGIRGLQRNKKAEALKNVLYMLLSPAIFAGTGASLVSKLAFQIIEALTGQDDAEEDFYRWTDEHFGEGGTVSRAARHGLTGAIAHINLRGSIQMNNPLPTTLAEVAGAPGSVAIDIVDSIIHFSKGEWSKGLEKGSPTAVGSAWKARREYKEGITTKTYAPVYYGNERLKASRADAALRFFSFNPSRLSSIRERQWRETKVNQAFTARRSAIKKNINQMIVQGTESDAKWADIYNQIQEYNERVHGSHDRYQAIYISDKWVKTAINSSYKPSKRELQRDIPGGE